MPFNDNVRLTNAVIDKLKSGRYLVTEVADRDLYSDPLGLPVGTRIKGVARVGPDLQFELESGGIEYARTVGGIVAARIHADGRITLMRYDAKRAALTVSLPRHPVTERLQSVTARLGGLFGRRVDFVEPVIDADGSVTGLNLVMTNGMTLPLGCKVGAGKSGAPIAVLTLNGHPL